MHIGFCIESMLFVQVGVPSRKSRFSFPRLEKNRGKLSEKDLEKESPGQENMSETAQADEEQADRGDLGPAKGRDDSKCSARQEVSTGTSGKRTLEKSCNLRSP